MNNLKLTLVIITGLTLFIGSSLLYYYKLSHMYDALALGQQLVRELQEDTSSYEEVFALYENAGWKYYIVEDYSELVERFIDTDARELDSLKWFVFIPFSYIDSWEINLLPSFEEVREIYMIQYIQRDGLVIPIIR